MTYLREPWPHRVDFSDRFRVIKDYCVRPNSDHRPIALMQLLMDHVRALGQDPSSPLKISETGHERSWDVGEATPSPNDKD